MQPASVTAAPDKLIAAYKLSRAELELQEATILTDPKAESQRRRIRAILAEVEEQLVALEAQTAAWLVDEVAGLPAVYRAGASQVPALAFSWTPIHVEAVTATAQKTYAEVLQATDYMRTDAKRWVRDTAKMMETRGYIEGITPKQLAAKLTKMAPKEVFRVAGAPQPTIGVVYKDRSVRRLDTYFEMLMRTLTAKTYNDAGINNGEQYGIDQYYILDGPDCGLTSHDDPNKPNDTIVDAATARANLISHPGCVRAITPYVA